MLFKCMAVGSSHFMTFDTRLLCFDATWTFNALYAMSMGILYILGIPALFFHLIQTARQVGSVLLSLYMHYLTADVCANETGWWSGGSG
jgi:hypothetical protein